MNLKPITSLVLIAALAFPASCFANYNCGGAVNYVGIDAGGNVVVAVGSTPIHSICNVVAQGSWAIAVPVCKAIYASVVAAKISGKTMTIFYGDNGATCTTFQPWGAVPSTYFVTGPE